MHCGLHANACWRRDGRPSASSSRCSPWPAANAAWTGPNPRPGRDSREGNRAFPPAGTRPGPGHPPHPGASPASGDPDLIEWPGREPREQRPAVQHHGRLANHRGPACRQARQPWQSATLARSAASQLARLFQPFHDSTASGPPPGHGLALPSSARSPPPTEQPSRPAPAKRVDSNIEVRFAPAADGNHGTASPAPHNGHAHRQDSPLTAASTIHPHPAGLAEPMACCPYSSWRAACAG